MKSPHAPEFADPALSDDVLRAEWIAAGGGIHGPNIETVTMPESTYFAFRRGLAPAAAIDPAQKALTDQVEGAAPLVYLEAYACSDSWSGPQFASVRADAALRARLLELATLWDRSGVVEARVRWGCDWGPGPVEETLRLENHELVVCGNEFWFRAQPEHEDAHVETRGVSIEEFVRATRDHVGDVPLRFGTYSASEWDEYLQAPAPSDDEHEPAEGMCL